MTIFKVVLLAYLETVLISTSVNTYSKKRKGVRLVFGMSLRSFPKTNCQSHAPEALRLRPDGLPMGTDQPLLHNRSQAKLLPLLPRVGCDLVHCQNRNAVAHVARRICPMADGLLLFSLLLFSTVARGRPHPVHFEHYLPGSSAPIGSTWGAQRADRGLPVGSEYASGWNQKLRRLQGRPMAGNSILLPVRRVCFGDWWSMRRAIMKRSGHCSCSPR